ncbi:MAG: DUF2894 domain-containing protein [Pseudomonadales bacterium]|nr:DUF2894 domain-containing protein [Pseudomonadales bacterium]
MSEKRDADITELTQLREQQGHLFDPARFHYIAVMMEKLQQSRSEGVQAVLNEKVSLALNAYKQDLATEKATMERLFAEFRHQYQGRLSAEQIDEGKQLFAQCQFRKLNQWMKRYQRQFKTGKGIAGLPSLLSQHPSIIEKNLQQLSLDDYLREQENNLLQALGESPENGAYVGTPAFSELKSLTLFRDSWVKLNTDKLVTQAIKEAPENAGPLNSHRLVIRSLSAIRDLSPAYMNRFVSYLDTLLWLESVGEDAGLLQDKKAGGKLKPGGRR